MNQMPPPESPASVASAPTALYQTYNSVSGPATVAAAGASSYGVSEPSTPTTLIPPYTNPYGLCPDFNMFWSPTWAFTATADVLHTDPSSSASCSADVNPALYFSNFANPLTRSLNPLTPNGGPNPYATAPQHQFGMPGQNVGASNGAVHYGNASIRRDGYGSGAGTPRPGSGSAKRSGGGRRPKEYEDYESGLTEDDREKRDKRRQRNKEAAARCRQRRLDLMTTLQHEVDQLKTRNAQSEMLIEQLKAERDILVRELSNHGCKIPNTVTSVTSTSLSSYSVPTSTVSSNSRPQSSSSQPLGTKRPHPDQNIYTVPLASIKSEVESDYNPASNGSSVSSMLPPPLNKMPKIQNQNQPPQTRIAGNPEPTLTQVNAPSGNSDLQRPDTLAIGGPTTCGDSQYDESKWSGMPSITTPSGLMTDGTYPFLYTDTGLTPVSAQPALPVCSLGTPTPLGDNELRSL
ncbi:hypothetical protein QR680_003678 [Steinernema hermaphroditum]|uniref:BZIP domain-containing protein n=1 Tax=Steinernema hermaphroditum TaxID=289476 RepID=A0AA39LSP0_9BILA|nr:hypothetical protein QR680_003678 [Steinernema hermaphroditum]